MSTWPTVELGAVATIDRTVVLPVNIDASTPYVGLENIERGGAITNVATVGESKILSAKFRFTEQQVLFGKLRPYLVKISRPTFSGVCSTDILPISPGVNLDKGYLCYFLSLPDTIALATSRASGANLPRLAPKELAKFQIPLPPITEQRRIAQVLDSVDALRAKRHKAIALLDDLTQSIFLEMFGDPALNPRGWERRRFESLLEVPLRNGLSPSTGGKVYAKVLTLSAITGSHFDPSAFKVAPFNSKPSEMQAVRAAVFLICRGNGNANLVGRGIFPPCDMLDTTFPDTVISARPSPLQVVPDYLRHVWESTEVRRQIRSAARTTNGTFKINQKTLELIEVPVPPLELQMSFVDRIRKISNVRSLQQSHLAELNALFASLQHRAFRGEMGDAPAA
jgi:type I restriction enzyme, S subunit